QLTTSRRSGGGFAQTFRSTAEGKPRCKRGEFFVLRPGRSKRFSKFGEAPLERGGLGAQRLLRAFEKLLFPNPHDLPAATPRCTRKRLAEKLSIRSVNQRMRCKNLFQTRERSSRSK